MQQDAIERENFERELDGYDHECCVFVDEMSAKRKSYFRRRGRSQKGKPAVVRQVARLMDTNTLTAACNPEGMMLDCCVVSAENNTRADFENYVVNILGPHMSAYPGKFLSCHKMQRYPQFS